MFNDTQEAVIFEHHIQDPRFHQARSGAELSRLVWCAITDARDIDNAGPTVTMDVHDACLMHDLAVWAIEHMDWSAQFVALVAEPKP